MAYTLNLGFSDEKSCEFKSRLQQERDKKKKKKEEKNGRGEIWKRKKNPEKI